MITLDELKSFLDYDAKSGFFVWRVNKKNAKQGARAGCKTHQGYRTIRINNIAYSEHVLAMFYMTGRWPKFVDHINRIKDDNRYCNLREVTPSQNQWNKNVASNNKSGHTGVSWNKVSCKWQVFIRVNGKNKNLGLFDDVEAAAKAYKTAALAYRGQFSSMADVSTS